MFALADLPFVTDETVYYLKSYAVVFAVSLIGATPLCRKLAQCTEKVKGSAVIQAVAVHAVLVVSPAYLVDGSYNPFLYFRF